VVFSFVPVDFSHFILRCFINVYGRAFLMPSRPVEISLSIRRAFLLRESDLWASFDETPIISLMASSRRFPELSFLHFMELMPESDM